uniref:Phosphomannomutase/phosphoglucomutase n=1 Tax=candidate division WOR-3 bacterium TaxID=2052148 RepID=A0A7C4U6Z3_UNCW3
MEKNIFKAYDIRGIYPDELNEKDAYVIGRSIAEYFDDDKIIVGYDARPSSIPLFENLKDGIIDSGKDVLNIGLVTTPMVSFVVGITGYPGVMITASHNPKEYNGFKIIGKDVLSIGFEFGLKDIMELALKGVFKKKGKGKVEDGDFFDEYVRFLKSNLNIKNRLKIVIDAFNGSTPLVLERLLKEIPLDFLRLNFDIDGNYPKHPPNPLQKDNLKEISDVIKNGDYDFGVCFDGDGDRCVFIDENGELVSPDLITAFLAREIDVKGEYVLVDVRTSRDVWNEIIKLGGKPKRVQVGHAYARRKLKKLNGVLGGELAGHYYFRSMFYADSGILAFVHFLNYFSEICGNKRFSEIVKELKRYHSTGEINFHTEKKDEIIEEVRNNFKDGDISELDGLTIEYENWWFNIRKSNTEPLLRLIVEAEDEKILNEKTELIKKIINFFG